MLEKLNGKKFVTFALIVIAVWAFALTRFSSYFVNVSMENPGAGYLIYFASNISYVAVFMALSRTGKLKGALAGILFIFAADAISYPHCIPSDARMPIQPENYACSDTITFNYLFHELKMPYTLAFWFYYWIMPLAMIAASIKLLGIGEFKKNIGVQPQ